MNADTRRKAAALRMGVDESQVEVRTMELSTMREAGLLVDVDIHGITMFFAKTSYGELGIRADDVRTERLRTGTKDLFPAYARKFRSLETRARQNLIAYSFKVTAFGGWYWLPWTAYEAWKDRHDTIAEALESLKLQCLADYDNQRERNREYFAQVAERAWKSILSSYAPGENVVVYLKDGSHYSQWDKALFIEHIVQRALGKMPLPEEIEFGVRIDYRTAILTSKSEVLEEQAREDAARAARAESRSARLEADADAKEIELRHWTIEEKHKARIQAFKAAELEHARKQLAEMSSPLLEALDELKAGIYKAASSMLDGLRKHGAFRGRSSAKSLLDYWRTLNGGILSDAELETELVRLDAEISNYKTARAGSSPDITPGNIISRLRNITAMTAKSARKQQSTKSRASALEI